jgi:ATPase family protein associated with various cellular activities (AAA)/winged helix domain-containing protein
VSVVAPPTSTEPAWLAGVRLRVLRRVLWCRELWERNRYLDEDGLAVSHSEVELVLLPHEELATAEAEFLLSNEHARRLTAELEALPEETRWVTLCSELELSAAEQALLALALAVELVPALRRVYGYVQNETTPVEATPALVADLWSLESPPRFGDDSALVRWALAHPVEGGAGPLSSSTGWIADAHVLDHLLAEGRSRTPGQLSQPVSLPDEPRLHQQELDDIVRFVEAVTGDGRALPLEVELVGPAGSGRTTLAAGAAARLGLDLTAVDARAIADLAEPVVAVRRELRAARLSKAVLVWEHADELPGPAVDAIRHGARLSFFATEQASTAGKGAAIRRSYVVPALTRTERLRLWQAGPGGPAPEPVAEWALRPAEIETLGPVAAAGDEAVREVCRHLLVEAPHELLSVLPQPYEWDDLIVAPQLAAHLREFEAQARARGEVLDDWGFARLTPLGRGVTALFAGPSGTGKTMAAQVLARSLGVELYRVDLAGVVNKYIGETEKHLRAVFAACERSPVMLFFDEADALFGRRMQVNDAHDRFANIEVDYLLQRMEEFDGVAVLATNRKGDLDAAFTRRLRFTIDFAPPTVDERERLWRWALEGSADADGKALVGKVDWSALAQEIDLTGAGIKSAALAAAFLARTDRTKIGTDHLLAAARRELEKEGVVVRARPAEAASS